jgi:chitinase
MKIRKSLSQIFVVLVLIATVVGVFPLTTAAATVPQTAVAATPAYNVTGYLCNWIPWIASDIDATKLTHINFAFANVSSSGKVIIGDTDVDPTYFNELKKLKNENPNLKTLIAVGGWTWSTNFHAAALTDASRTTFADSAVAFMKTYGFDGVDIDWEYPNQPGNDNPYGPEDKHNFTLLLQKLREKLDAQGIADGGKHYLLTIASGASQTYAQNVEFSELQQYVDFINIMTYDFYGSWERKTGHASALMDPSGQNQFSVDSAVKIHMNNGVPANKIVVGCAFYGHSWSGVTNSNNGLYQSYSGFANDELTYTQLASSYINKNGYTRYWDGQAKAPYLWNGNTFITYDDEQSLQEKAAYIKSKGLGGAMFWEYTQDFSGTLLTALWNNLKGDAESIATPTFSPAAGTYNSPQSVAISCATAGATIRYTTDGSTPTATSPVYSATISVTSGVVTIKAIASKSGMADSAVASATYTITPVNQVAAPTFNPAAGTYTTAQSITITCSTPDAVIRYTTDGSTPTSASTAYTGAIPIAKTTTIKAIATKAGMADSIVVSSTYTINDGTISPWAPNTAYNVGDKVSYGGKNYTCRQSHTSLPGWEPINVPALWQQL